MKLFKFIYCMIFGHKPYLFERKYGWIEIHGKEIITCDRCKLVVEVEKK